MSESVPFKTGGHMPQLDGLRALAVFLVILHHTLPPVPISPFELGAAGVQLFFVLSGFLITGILLRAREQAEEQRQNCGQIVYAFYVRRFLRIFPLYYAVLALAMLVGIPEARAPAAWHLAYGTNLYCFVAKTWVGPLSHFWSLAVEEQFYLVWPAIVLFLPRRLLGTFFVGAILTAPVFRLTVVIATRNPLVFILTPSCLDSLGIGSLLAFLWQTRAPAQVRLICWCWLAGGLILLLGLKGPWSFGPFQSLIHIGLMNSTLALLYVWLVHGAAHGFRGPIGYFLASPPLVYLGNISYGLYVWQMFAAFPSDVYLSWVSAYYPRDFGGLRLLFVAVFSVVCASLTWFLLERPINSLKRFFPYLQRTDTAEPGAKSGPA